MPSIVGTDRGAILLLRFCFKGSFVEVPRALLSKLSTESINLFFPDLNVHWLLKALTQ